MLLFSFFFSLHLLGFCFSSFLRLYAFIFAVWFTLSFIAAALWHVMHWHRRRSRTSGPDNIITMQYALDKHESCARLHICYQLSIAQCGLRWWHKLYLIAAKPNASRWVVAYCSLCYTLPPVLQLFLSLYLFYSGHLSIVTVYECEQKERSNSTK